MPIEPLRPDARWTSRVESTAPSARAVANAPVAAGDALAVVRRRVPYINQLHPAGEEAGYAHGFSNCGPTSMAMVARAFGRGEAYSDAGLILKLAALGGTTEKGSSPAAIVKMANGMGLAGEAHGPGPDLAWIDAQLAQGRLVVAHGNYFGLPPHDQERRTWAGGHFLVVAGKAADGNYVLRDPLDPAIHEVPPADLVRFIGSHPTRGHQIAVGER